MFVAEAGPEEGLVVNVWAIDMMFEHKAQVEVARDDMRLVVEVTGGALCWGQNGLLLFRKAELGVEASGWGKETPG